jgi:hypothetical protein
MKLKKQTIIFFLILIVVATVVKIICAPEINLSGFTAVIAISLFAGLTVRDKKLAFILPLATLFISDVILQVLYQFHLFPYAGFYGGQIYNYALFFLLTFLGMWLRNYKTAGIFTAAFVGPTVFFLLSNFIVWKSGAAAMGYNTDISGLWQSYTFGLPFYRNSIISTVIFLPAFVALYNRMAYGKITLAKTA